MLICPYEVTTPSPSSFLFTMYVLSISTTSFRVGETEEALDTRILIIPGCGHCQRNGLNNPVTSAHATARSEHILAHHSQEVSSGVTLAYQLFYSDSGMSCTELVICCQSNLYFRYLHCFFSFQCWQFGFVKMKLQPSLSSLLFLHWDYQLLPTSLTMLDFRKCYHASQRP